MSGLDASWTDAQGLAPLVTALGAGNARYVGGVVRDTLLGLPVKDIDIATVLPPREVMARCKAAGIKTIPTGIDHGTVTALVDGRGIEITTLRRDVATDGRRATVAFSDDWREDAARRDFTINALYADPTSGGVSDFFGGEEDLAERRVRFIGDPSERIREDHLRILRYFRFQARFGSQPADPGSENACAELAPTLMGLSRERVGMEMMNLLALPDPAPTVARMVELGVLPVILPDANAATLSTLIEVERREGAAPDPLRRLAALLPRDPAAAEQVAARLRLSGAQKKRLALAAMRGQDDGDPRALAYRIGLEAARDRLLLDGRSIAVLAGWTTPAFPLKGGEIVARGVKAGPDVARILQAVERRWVDEGFPDRARVEALLEAELVSFPKASAP
jgi:poly(A) polymerase